MTSPGRLAAARRRKKVWRFLDPADPRGMPVLLQAHLDSLRVKGYSERTVKSAEWTISEFVVWAEERGVRRAQDVTKPMLERYQRTLFYAEKPDGAPLTLSTQHHRLSFLKQFFRWLTRNNFILSNPASELELPKVEKRLPKHVLTHAEAEQILAQPELDKPHGIRDRAILETFYSTGIRRSELSGVRLWDVDTERGILTVRQGKGRKDRVVPIGERASAWVEKYVREVRASFVVEPDAGYVFLSADGEPIAPKTLSLYVSRYVKASGLLKTGSCHLFRHAMATAMLENGADVRMIQAMLGHVRLTTTEIYTHVSIRKLKEIHTATHPSARLLRAPTEKEPAEENERPPATLEPGQGPGVR
jgi:integrase/recombinase XerD